MIWNRKWRERRKLEKALDKECKELRYISVFADLDELEDEDLVALLRRVVEARKLLEKVIYAHDDSPARLATTGIGAGSVAIGVVTLGSGPIILPLLGILAGTGLVARDIVGLGATIIKQSNDEELLIVLKNLAARLRLILQGR